MQSFLGESSTTITGSLSSIWTSASEVVTNLAGNIKNLFPQYNNQLFMMKDKNSLWYSLVIELLSFNEPF